MLGDCNYNSCSTNCLEYQRSSPNDNIVYVDIVPNAYNLCCANPAILSSRIFTSQIDPSIFTLTIGVDNPNPIRITVDTSGPEIKVFNNNPGVRVLPFFDVRSIEVNVILSLGNPLPEELYVPDDRYIFYLIDGTCSRKSLYASAVFVRNYNINVSSDLNSNPSSNLISNLSTFQLVPSSETTLQSIPKIHIEAQTTIMGSDVSDAIFRIYDEFTYYDKDTIPDNTCHERISNNIKTTIFRQCCPYMVSVVKGEGATLLEKIIYLFNQGDTNNPNSYVFYQNMILYGMAKYILSRLLYGKFNINYLLGKYNERFLKKLSGSRFCAFNAFFEQNDYNEYFLFDNRNNVM